ncbi:MULTISPECIES: enterochelin esterase [Cronobacter]|uniref:Enterochelin esterase n=1 Tax=Cronobacter muytjensii TaxID=413501 RepID=A0A2T7AZ84_9ENTR|nr:MULTISPECIES: enterochelin esterase [Cronobacter]ELY6343358.1 enterochelin esterase [Cronobacter muytjensii]KAB0878870.1 enterochelin esterase [Cronobacter muytjensii]MBF4811110.1 enterochelin esterase [Cronobacter muytjensii]PUX18001.1 enterochelin esterase [Cronobacter muytjensii]
MAVHATGSEAWWQAKQAQGVPEISGAQQGKCSVTFWWRDPAGDETTSDVQRVWIYITGITDHHKPSAPQSLTRLPGTDAWFWRTALSEHWRGSYCFIPSTRPDDFAPEAFSDTPARHALREGWRKLLPQALSDPLNPHHWRGGRGHPVSALHLPGAPAQPGWEEGEVAYTPAEEFLWRSDRLGNQRRVWLFTTGGNDAPEARPLAILLDGQFWAHSQPVWPALQRLTDRGVLPPAVYLLVDVIDTAHRSEELPCNAVFWEALWEELLPLARAKTAWRDAPQTTVVAGQSFGGLSALYAGLHWPQRFGCVLSQSGSFWWPKRDANGDGWLVEALAAGRLDPRPLRIFLEAGLYEPLILQANQRLVSLLQQTQQPLFWRQVDGGHDALCWRGGLTEGLAALWGSPHAPARF